MAAAKYFIRVWHASCLGCAVSRRCEELVACWQVERLKSRLKSCGENFQAHPPVLFESPQAIDIGSDVSIAPFVHIWGGGGVSIGDRTMIGSHSSISSVTHDYHQCVMRESVVAKPIAIGPDVWIGSHVIIVPGVTIGAGAVLGAGCVVTHDVPPGQIMAGIPARPIKLRPPGTFPAGTSSEPNT